MSNSFSCPNCGQKLTAKPEMAGVIIDCPSCGSQIQVPAFEAPVPMAPQPQSYPQTAIPQRFQNPMASQQMGFPQQYDPTALSTYGQPKSKRGVLLALIAVVAIAILGVGSFMFIGGHSDKAKVTKVVNTVLVANRRGDYGGEYWVDWKQDKLLKLFTPTAWEILSVEIGTSEAKVLVHADSSNREGVKISCVWIYKLSKEYGKWKVRDLAPKED